MKITCFFLCLCLLFSLCSCSNSDAAPTNTPSPSPVQPTEDPTAANGGVYIFKDASVQDNVESLLDKDDLSEKDRQLLAEMKTLFLEGGISSLEDLPFLFPNLVYLSVSFLNSIPASAYDTLQSMQSLKAVTLYSPAGFERFDFLEGYEYVCLRQDAAAENALPLTAASLSSGDIAADLAPLSYSRLICGHHVLELFDGKNGQSGSETESTLFVYTKNGGGLERLQQIPVKERTVTAGGLYYIDVDFDGLEDILVENGSFGVQGLLSYTCLLQRNGRFVLCQSFSAIANVAVDHENQKILSSWRNSAASHSWAMYSFIDGEFVMTDRLTETALPDSDALYYTEEALTDGALQVAREFSTAEYSDDEIAAAYFDAESLWALDSDKWRSINNLGNILDYSIYNSKSISAMLVQMIEMP